MSEYRDLLTSTAFQSDNITINDFNDLTEEEQMALIMSLPVVSDANAPESDGMDVNMNEYTESAGGNVVGATGGETIVLDNLVNDEPTRVQTPPTQQLQAAPQQQFPEPLESEINSERRTVQAQANEQTTVPPQQQQSESARGDIVVEESTNETRRNELPATAPQKQPQRRGVEIDPNRYADAQHVPPKGGNNGRKPRRVRLTTPLGVMAQRALNEQIKTNSLLVAMLAELRKRK